MFALTYSAVSFWCLVLPNAPPIPVTDADEFVLRAGGVRTVNQELLALLSRIERSERQLKQLPDLIRGLGAPKYSERAAASEALIKLGAAAEPALVMAADVPDAEVSAAARRCLGQIRSKSNATTLECAAARLLVRRGVVNATSAFIGALPYCHDGSVLETELVGGIDLLCCQSRRVPEDLLAALESLNPVRRAAAACIVGRRGSPNEKQKVRPLLNDQHSLVRLRAAQGLLASGEKDAIPILIALLDAAPVAQALQAHELLHWAANGSGPETLVWCEADAARKCRLAWQKWWRDNGAGVDFSAATRQPRRPLLFAVKNRTAAGFGPQVLGCDGIRGAVPALAVGEVVPSGHLLVAGVPWELWGKSSAPHVMETDWDGRVFWSYEVPYHETVTRLERLADGRIHFVAGHLGHFLLMPNGSPIISPGQEVPYFASKAFPQKREPTVPDHLGFAHLTTLRLEPKRRRLVELDGGRVVGEMPCQSDEGSRVVVVLPLVRLGFDDLPGRDYDLATSLPDRLTVLRTGSPLARELSLTALRGDFKGDLPGAIPALFAAFGDQCADPRFRNYQFYETFIEAIRSISRDPISDAIQHANSPSERTRAAAVVILGLHDWKEQRAAERWGVVRGAFADSSSLVRFAAIARAGSFGSHWAEVVPLLIRAIDDDSMPIEGEPSVGARAAGALCAFRDHASSAVPKLKAAARGNDVRRAGQAAHALGCIAMADPTGFPDAFSWFAVALKDSSAAPEMRCAAAKVVPHLGKTPEAVAQLLAVELSGASSPPSSVKHAIMTALRELKQGARPAIPALRAALLDADPEIRRQAQISLSLIER